MKTRIVFLIAITFCVATVANAQTPKEISRLWSEDPVRRGGIGADGDSCCTGSVARRRFGSSISLHSLRSITSSCPDQIGFGKSDKPLVNYRIRTYVDFLDQFCKQLKIERATLVGNSMGGWIAAMFTASFPDRVDKLVLVDAAGYAPPKDFDTRVFFGLESDDAEKA